MTERIITPQGRGYLMFDAHPAGCARLVEDMWEQAGPRAAVGDGPVALVIGSSSGYGLAATVAGLARHGIRGIGVALEKPAARRSASAGWYRTVATARLAAENGRDFTFVNADAFAAETKETVLDAVEKRFGGVDVLIYSVAAPRRTDPATGVTHASALKTIGAPHTTRTLRFDADGAAVVEQAEVEAAATSEVDATVKVMGGEDWRLWVEALDGRGLLNDGFRSVALSYIGSHLTEAIYRQGTIGAAKKHLEATARELDARLAERGGRVLTSVNGAAVTQASTAIPAIGLYIGLLRGVLGTEMRSPVAQLSSLWDQLTGAAPLELDEEDRLRLDLWELDPAVQESVTARWDATTPENVGEKADTAWFHTEVRRLYGFDVDGVDYAKPVETDLAWPASSGA